MTDHKFHLGQKVALAERGLRGNATRGTYTIIKMLPERDGEFDYRIKSVSEPHERVARESELRRE